MKRKEFLMSLGLLSIAPNLLSKNVESELSDNREEFKSNLLTLTMYQVGHINEILDKDLVWIMKPSKDNDGTYIPVVEGYVNKRVNVMDAFVKVEVVVLRQLSKLTNDDSMVLYHTTTAVDTSIYHRRLAIEKAVG